MYIYSDKDMYMVRFITIMYIIKAKGIYIQNITNKSFLPSMTMTM